MSLSRLYTYNKDNRLNIPITAMDQKEIQQYNNDLRIPQEFKESRI